jgi:glycyl-tRNA synthetase beta subunit
LALADRLDTLVSLFAVGLAPKGNADPFGLRRAALGVVQILTHHAIDLDLTVAIERVARAQSIEVSVESRQTLADFIRGRLEGLVDRTRPRA